MKRFSLIVMAKAPLAGFAKTRLIPRLGPEGAAQLAHQLFMHTLTQVQALQMQALQMPPMGSANPEPFMVDAQLWVTPEPEHPGWQPLRNLINLPWFDQGEGDLGARLTNACQGAKTKGQPIMVIGTDCPALSADLMAEAARALNSADAVIIPAFDGGYVLLGMNQFEPSLFEGISWSSERVMNQTLERLEALQWTVTLLPPVHDIDEAEDLRWLPDTMGPANG